MRSGERKEYPWFLKGSLETSKIVEELDGNFLRLDHSVLHGRHH